MLTLDRKQQPIALQERRAASPPLLGGALFGALASVPLAAPTAWDSVRVLGLLGLLAMATLLAALGRPRARTRPVPGLAKSGPRPLRLELAGEPLPPLYRAELVLSDGARLVVLEGPEPAGVLEDASELCSLLGVPLVPAWGLDERTLEGFAHPTTAPAAPRIDQTLSFDSPEIPGRRDAAFATLWASAFVLGATVVMSESARATVEPSALSVVLPIIGATLVLIAGLWLLGLRGMVVLGPTGVVSRRSWFKKELGTRAGLEAEILGAALVAPTGGPTGHLLVRTPQGLRSFLVWGTTPQGDLLGRVQTPAQATRAAE